MTHAAIVPLTARRTTSLRGHMRVRGDTISHRALTPGAFAVGETRVTGLPRGLGANLQ